MYLSHEAGLGEDLPDRGPLGLGQGQDGQAGGAAIVAEVVHCCLQTGHAEQLGDLPQ